MAQGTRQLTGLRRITPDDAARLVAFFADVPEGDRTFFKEGAEPETVERWVREEHVGRWVVAGEDGGVRAFLAIVPGVGWSAHVGELRLVVGAAHRRQGIGRALARHGLTEAVRFGFRKIVVEVVADKEGDLEMFTSIGFEAEALLKDHFLDRRTGITRDLVVLAHDVAEMSSSMGTLGFDRADDVGTAG
jgi:ribosomal protein S18 acetylase RimI-like enzyme